MIKTSAINAHREKCLRNMELARINEEARIASDIQKETGCTRTEALIAAKQLVQRSFG